MVGCSAPYGLSGSYCRGVTMSTYRATLKSRIFLAAILFSMAFLDSDFHPFGNIRDFLNSAFVLLVIFIGDHFWFWIKARL